MSAEYREKLKSIGFDRKHLSKTWVVPHDDTGEPTGTQTEHRDGRLDATVMAPAVAHKATVSEER